MRTTNSSAEFEIMWRLYVCLLVAATFAAPLAAAWSSSDNTNPEPTSICIHCYCSTNTVICDFAHNKTLSPIWNSKYWVPNTTTGMELRLLDGIHFQLQGGFFRENRVNGFVVKGPNVSNGNDQVEFLDNSFRGNTGGYPEINIIGVSSVFVRSKAFSDGEIKLHMTNSALLVLFPNAFVNMNMTCSLTNIDSLQINESAFHPSIDRTAKARVNLHVGNSHIDQINRFDVSMNRIVFVNCTIGSVQSGAFDVTNINQLNFEDCRIHKIEAGAFTSKLLSDHVSITGNQIGTIDSKAIMGSGISKLTLRKNTIDTIKEGAILVHSVYVYIDGNRINHQGKNWLHVNNGELIAIEHNRFENFAPTRLESVNWKRANCTFANNSLGNIEPGSLNFSNCEVHAIQVDRVCNCEDGKHWLPTLTDHDLSSELYCKLGERVVRCFNASRVHMRRYANEACNGGNRSTLRCVDGSTMEWHKDDFYTKEEREERQRAPTIWQVVFHIVLGICVVSAVTIPLLWLLWLSCRRTKPRQDLCQLSDNDCHTLNQEMKPMSNTPTKRLIKKLVSGKLSREQCYEISLRLSSKCNELPEKSNKVIARHMQEEHSRREPQILAGTDDDARSINDIFYASTMASAPSNEQLSVQDHIYSLPLLPNQYALPSDTQDISGMPVYSEPINSANADDMPPAYDEMPQYAMPLPHHHPHLQQQLPSTSAAAAAAAAAAASQQQRVGNASIASYATPVWRQAPGATPISIATPIAPELPQRHVRDLRQDLEAMPQFHPNQLSSARTQTQLQSRFPTNPRRLPAANAPNAPNNSSIPSMRSFECLDGADTMAAMELMDMRGAAALPPDSGSDHSGGSDETVKIDDIEYADA